MNRGRMWGLAGLACVMLSDFSLIRCKLIRIAVTLSDMSDTYLLLSFHSNATSLCCYENDDDVTTW
jgi:hypothetical protein